VDDIISFIKSDGSPLVNLIKLVVITFSIWMIQRMRIYARFQVKIDVSRVFFFSLNVSLVDTNHKNQQITKDTSSTSQKDQSSQYTKSGPTKPREHQQKKN